MHGANYAQSKTTADPVESKRMLTVSCPVCSKPVTWVPENRDRPFCSARCRQIDLGAWASESYCVPSAPTDEIDPPEFTATPRE